MARSISSGYNTYTARHMFKKNESKSIGNLILDFSHFRVCRKFDELDSDASEHTSDSLAGRSFSEAENSLIVCFNPSDYNVYSFQMVALITKDVVVLVKYRTKACLLAKNFIEVIFDYPASSAVPYRRAATYTTLRR